MSGKFWAVVLIALVAGCQSQPAARQPSIHELGLRQWNTTRAQVLLSLAGDQYKTGNFDKCRQTLDDALQLDPSNGSYQPRASMKSAAGRSSHCVTRIATCIPVPNRAVLRWVSWLGVQPSTRASWGQVSERSRRWWSSAS